MSLYPFQQEGLEAIRAALMAERWSQVLVIPTGGGKTHMFAHLPLVLRDWLEGWSESIERPVGHWTDGSRRARMLILAHREELLDQAARKMMEINPSLMVGIEQGERRHGPFDDVVIASVATLASSNSRRLEKLRPEEFRIIVVDEVHHARAATYQRILNHFGVVPPESCWPTGKGESEMDAARARCAAWWKETPPERLLLGVTATPDRADGLGLEWSFQSIVYEKTLRWMIENGYLVSPRGYMVDTKTDLDAVTIKRGDFAIGELSQAVNTPERNLLAVDAWMVRAKGRQTLGFTVDIQHAVDLASAFQARGIRADWASGERREAVQWFRDGKIDVLCSCSLVSEGFDHPPAGCAVMMRPTRSRTLYTQQIGRVLRLSEGKTDAVVIDVCDVSRKHQLVTAGDLVGLPKHFDVKGATLISALEAVEAATETAPGVDLSTVKTVADVEKRIKAFDLWTVKEPTAIQSFAGLAWVTAGDTAYRIALPKRNEETGSMYGARDLVEVKQDLLGQWQGWLNDGETHQRTLIAGPTSLAQAIRASETWIQTSRPDVVQMKSKDARWRTKGASPKQVALLERLGAKFNPETLTRGEASAMLDQHFARHPRRA